MSHRTDARTQLYKSEIVTVATTITIAGMSPTSVNHFAGCRYYADSAGAATAVPAAGTVAIQGLDATTNEFTDFATSPLTSTDVTDKTSATANITEVKAVPTGLTTATHYQLFVTSNV
jgi:hypothetical protein